MSCSSSRMPDVDDEVILGHESAVSFRSFMVSKGWRRPMRRPFLVWVFDKVENLEEKKKKRVILECPLSTLTKKWKQKMG